MTLGGILRPAAERLHVVRQLLLARQVSLPQQEDDLLERRLLDEVVDVESAIEQPPFAAVDETDFRGRDDDVFEAGFPYGAHGSPACRCEKRLGSIIAREALQGREPLPSTSTTGIRSTRRTFARRPPAAPPGASPAEDLFDFDQDHYGGIGAVDVLARRARRQGSVARPRRLRGARRPCAVPGEPAGLPRRRHRAPRGPGRGRRAADPRRRAWPQRWRWCAATRARCRFRHQAFDVCLSQEGLLHIADKVDRARRVPPRAGARRPPRLLRLGGAPAAG